MSDKEYVGKLKIEGVQCMRPNGRRVPFSTYVDDDPATRRGYVALRDRPCVITAEVLTTGEVSLAIETHCGDYACELAENGPDVQVKLVALLQRFKVPDFDRWLQTEQGMEAEDER